MEKLNEIIERNINIFEVSDVEISYGDHGNIIIFEMGPYAKKICPLNWRQATFWFKAVCVHAVSDFIKHATKAIEGANGHPGFKVCRENRVLCDIICQNISVEFDGEICQIHVTR